MLTKIGSLALAAFLAPSTAAGSGPAAPAACSGAMAPGLAAPAGNELAFALRADGVQIYSCASAAGAAPAWTLKAPDATLLDERGQRAGTHGAGPTWEAADGSSVVGVKVEAATPDATAIPWLLLRATSHGSARGRMADVTFVQRVQTSGGLAPSEGCGASTVGSVARVPYAALYCFYRGAGAGSDAQGATAAPSHGARP